MIDKPARDLLRACLLDGKAARDAYSAWKTHANDASDRHEGTGEPSIDCLMVTLPVAARLPFAKRSIRDFCRQTYRNKQLIVMIKGGTRNISQELHGYIHALGRPDIVVLEPKGQFNLGQLRNLSIEAATADIVCQWDDDDLNHPERLELQARHLNDAGYGRADLPFFDAYGHCAPVSIHA